jgi:hypothetical protein
MKVASKPDEEDAMNAIVANILMDQAAKAQPNTSAFNMVAFFCSVGFIASLCLASLGLDVGSGFF